MRLLTTRPFEADYAALPERFRKLADQKLALFVESPRHPSLRIKKMHDPRGIWEGRITREYRFTFQMAGDACIHRRIGPHSILKTP